jgi:hypothetical protein
MWGSNNSFYTPILLPRERSILFKQDFNKPCAKQKLATSLAGAVHNGEGRGDTGSERWLPTGTEMVEGGTYINSAWPVNVGKDTVLCGV